MSSPSALDRPITLAELSDAASLEEVIRSFAEFHGVPFAVLDLDGSQRAQAGTEPAVCDLLRDIPEANRRCTAKRQEAHQLLVQAPSEAAQVVSTDCFCGMRYSTYPIRHEGSRLGAIVLGPYWPESRPKQPSGALAATVGSALPELENALANLRPLPDEKAHRLLEHAARALEVVLHAAYARHLAGQLHLAAIQDAYNQLEDKNKRLHEAVERMQEADRIKSNFMATISHELRTPLTSVIGYSEMLLEGLAGALNEEQREYVHTIMEKGDSLLQLISGILDVSRMESGTLKLRTEPVDLRDVIVTTTSALAPALKRKRLKLDLVDAADAQLVSGDRDKIRQILMNLLGNAIKFTPEGGHITVVVEAGQLGRDDEHDRFGAAEHAHRGFRLLVRDSGIGIAKEKQARIFEPFFQVDSSSTREYGGTGLGLTLVKNLVEAQGGRVWVDSELGRGSVFTVTFPAHLAGD
jgi:two-component system sensor histidine kinase BarA